jgi:pimeloyl-ACP methyl ester carboxylesterase
VTSTVTCDRHWNPDIEMDSRDDTASNADAAFSTWDIRYGSTNTRTINVQGSGRPIILLHPFGVTASTWGPVLGSLGRSGNSAYAPDSIGAGRADGFANGPLLPQLDEFVGAVVAAHSTEGPVTLVGVSHSAVLALRAAAAAPQNVNAVIAIGVPHRESPIARYRAITRRSSVPQPSKPLRRELSHLSSDSPVTCPTLIVQGLRGTSGAINSARRLQEALPHSRLALLPRSGPFTHLDNPLRIAAYARELATMAP